MILNFLLTSLRLLLKTGFVLASVKDGAFKKQLKENDFLLQLKLFPSKIPA